MTSQDFAPEPRDYGDTIDGREEAFAGCDATMIQSSQLAGLIGALAKAQGRFEAPKKDREVTVTPRDTTKKPYTFKYATLDSIMSAVRGPLSENGLAIVQIIIPDQGRHKLRTLLMHSSGQYLGSEAPLRVGDQSNQAFGSALTYMRRYAISALLGVVADEDDDGNKADGNFAVPKDAPAPAVTKPRAAPLPPPPPPPVQDPPRPAPQPAAKPPAPPVPPPAKEAPGAPPAFQSKAAVPVEGPGIEPAGETRKLTSAEAIKLFNALSAEWITLDSKDKLQTWIASHDADLDAIAATGASAAKIVDTKIRQPVTDRLNNWR